MPRDLDVRLQLVLEPHSNWAWLIEEAVAGGVTCVQWRDKHLSDADFYQRAVRIHEICKALKVPLIINDRVDIALAIGAEAIHLGQSDIPFHVARRLLPTSVSIGLSAESLAQVESAEELEVDYLAISPVFSTKTKADIQTPFGLEGLQQARALSRHVLVAIGGIEACNAAQVREAGADGLAVVSAICRSSSPAQAAKDLMR